MYKFKLEKFEGPLDLLLGLIQEEKFDISEVSLAKVTDEYLNHIEKNVEISPEELADFLVIATKLLLIKSRQLIPDAPSDDETDNSGLANQLRIYKEYLQAMQTIQGLISKRNFWYWREKTPLQLSPSFSPGSQLNSDKLKQAFIGIIKSLEKLVVLPQSVMEKTVSLQEKIGQLKVLIKNVSGLSFKNIIEQARSRTEIIVSFLALLELIKQQEIEVNQDNNFDDILISKYGT